MKKKGWIQVGIVFICIAINLLGRNMASNMKLPIWLDSVGTCVAAYFSGPIGAVVTGVANNVLLGIFDSMAAVYAVTSVIIALAMSYCAKKGYLDDFFKAVTAGFLLGVVCMVCSTPLNLMFYEGYSGNVWGDALFDMLKWYGMSNLSCALAGEAFVEIVDKQICLIVAFGIIRLFRHKKTIFAENRLTNKASIMVFILILSMVMAPLITSLEVRADSVDESGAYNYVGEIYNNTNGMMSSEANVIEETDDGCIWIGSYAGLTRYDGKDFEFIRDGGITNVTAMMNDSQGRLWIGTNDSGIARYENGEITLFTMEDGLPANSIRSLTEDEKGNIYVGTTDRICKFNERDNITVLEQEIYYVISMEMQDDILVCVDNNGNLYALKQDVLYAGITKEESGLFCNCIEKTSQGILVGSDTEKLYRLELTSTGMDLSDTGYRVVNDVISIEEDAHGHVWICAESGFGFVDDNGKFRELRQEGFDASLECIHEDYQGNLWLASSRYGVLKLSTSQFVNVFTESGVEGAVVNAVAKYEGAFYCGTDNGLVILQEGNYNPMWNELTTKLEGVRIRSLMVDTNNRLWISTYGPDGLICYEATGDMEIFTMDTKGVTSDRFRCSTELADGTMVAGTADGINFIKDTELVGRITTEDANMNNSQILSMITDEKDILYAGSDGSGIYVIENKKIVDVINTEDGLTSNVILRMIPYGNGFFAVTSNSLCFVENGEARALRSFPYFNNYDICIWGERAYVLSSAGVYVSSPEELYTDKETQYRLLSSNDGLMAGLTANAWNYIEEDGTLYLCSNSGVVRYQEPTAEEEGLYKYGIVSVECDGEKVVEDGGIYHLPLTAQNITIHASVQNYALKDVSVKFYVDGMGNEPQAVSYLDLEPIHMSNLLHGDYKVYIQIIDNNDGRVLQEQIYLLKKEIQMWENWWFIAYLIIVCIEIVVFVTWAIVSLSNISKRKTELEKMRQELEEKLARQIEELRCQEEKTTLMFKNTVAALSDSVDAKDRYTSGHSKRVAAYSRMIAAKMGKSEEEQDNIYFAGLLHDVGKIRVPEDIINKPGKLTDEEYELMKIHPVTGFHILKDVSEDSFIAIGAKFHHERYDGKGYPNGLSGDNIPEIGRILGVADAYDAMASNRSYRNALPQSVVREELIKGKGTQFDPDIADIMIQMIDEDIKYNMKQLDTVKKQILVVDDDEVNIRIIEGIMKDDPMYVVMGVTSGWDALKMLEVYKADLILLDIEMPEMDGFATLEEVRKITDAPVVFMTADRELETIQRAEAMDVSDYVNKPFLPMALKEAVHSILR